MTKSNYIKIDGDNNISLQDISGSNITINANDIDVIKKMFQLTEPEYLKKLFHEIEDKYNNLIEANQHTTEIILSHLKNELERRNITISDSKNILQGNTFSRISNLNVGDTIHHHHYENKKADKSNKIDIDQKFRYTCNRSDEQELFEGAFDKCQTLCVQSYIIHGFSDQLPDILPVRFFDDYICDNENKSQMEVIRIPNVRNFKKLKIDVLQKMFDSFSNGFDYKALTGSEFVKLPQFKQTPYAAINFKIESRYWDFIYPFVEYFTSDFLKNLQSKPNKTKFIFFWTIEYKDDIRKETILKRMLKLSRKEKILKQINFINPNLIIPELQPVLRDDLETWITEIEENAKVEVAKFYNLIEEMFTIKNKNDFTMREVVNMFDKLIETLKRKENE